MEYSKKLDIWGSVIILMSVLFQLFILSSFEASLTKGYFLTTIENQAVLRELIHEVGRGVLVPELGSVDRLHEHSRRFTLFSQIYPWQTELNWARWISGFSFFVGSGLVIAGKIHPSKPKH